MGGLKKREATKGFPEEGRPARAGIGIMGMNKLCSAIVFY
jgi:hypothetical protein